MGKIMQENVEIEYLRITNSSHPLVEKIKNTYENSFPEVERRDFQLVKELIDYSPLFKAYAFIKEHDYIGFLTAWYFDEFRYIEHFAIDSTIRNGGIGGKALAAFITQDDLPIILEVELPEDEMSRRRIGFYERFGFKLNSDVYYQPPYRKGEEKLEMRLMSLGDIDQGKDAFEKMKGLIYTHVYGVK
ncbi:GNAT family N-acetyltransferase [Parabacteroides sp. OttesenSCG-928-G07]|nr:GNAT family N-acetyltransferase [Parabacteroides sp. OttesenSCG-928-G21]MDL2278783.1 GNAT family N-acetyltransferase [Parabacteroides sp. OttesenSCG-928-G07]